MKKIIENIKVIQIGKKLTTMIVSDTKAELPCAVVSYFIYLYSHQVEWLLCSFPALIGIYVTQNNRIYKWTPFFFSLYMIGCWYAHFPNTLIVTSWLAALILLCLKPGISISHRIYQLLRHSFLALYYTSLIILFLILLYILVSLTGISTQELLQNVLTGICFFCFSVVFPSLFFVIDLHRSKEIISIPKWLGWLQFITETFLLICIVYVGYCIVQIGIYSRTPKPYVIYWVLFLIAAIELSTKLHDWVPKKWNSLFFSQRSLIYLPLLFLGLAGLYLEYVIIGFTPRTLAATVLPGWFAIICLGRVLNIKPVKREERRISQYAMAILMISVFVFSIIMA